VTYIILCYRVSLTYAQRRRLAAGLVFEKRQARLQSPVLKIELKIILNLIYKGRPAAAAD